MLPAQQSLSPVLLHYVHDGVGLVRLAIIADDLCIPFRVIEIEYGEVFRRTEIAAHPRFISVCLSGIGFEELLACAAGTWSSLPSSILNGRW